MYGSGMGLDGAVAAIQRSAHAAVAAVQSAAAGMERSDLRERFPVHAAVYALNSPSAVNASGPCGITALHLASAYGLGKAVSLLLSAGADGTALTVALDSSLLASSAQLRGTELFRFLEAQCPGRQEAELLHLARCLCGNPATPLDAAIRCCHVDVASRLLYSAGGNLGWHLKRAGGAVRSLLIGLSGPQAAAVPGAAATEAALEMLQMLLQRGMPAFGGGLLPHVLASCRELLPDLSTQRWRDALLVRALSRLVDRCCWPRNAGGRPPLLSLPAENQLRVLLAAVLLGHEAAALAVVDAQNACADAARRWREPYPGLLAEAFCLAAAHNMPPVLEALLAAQTSDGAHVCDPGLWWAEPPLLRLEDMEVPITALMAAARFDAVDAARLLLERGAAANAADQTGATALHHCAVKGSVGVAQLLLEHGAAVATPAQVVWQSSGEIEHLDMPLATACITGDIGMVRLLVRHGAALNGVSAGGCCALSVALSWSRLPLVTELLAMGADPNILPPADVNEGQFAVYESAYRIEGAGTLLGVALSSVAYADDDTSMAALLLRAGADPCQCGRDGRTALGSLAGWDMPKACTFLLEESGRGLQELGIAGALRSAMKPFGPWEPEPTIELLLRALEAQPPGSLHPSGAERDAIVDALLGRVRHTAQQWAVGLEAHANQVAIYQREWLRDWARLAERLANLGIAANFDPAARLAAYPPACRPVVLAAAHAAGRWSPALARHYPPAFRAAVQELVRISSPLALRQRQGRRRSPWPALPQEVVHRIISLAPLSSWM